MNPFYNSCKFLLLLLMLLLLLSVQVSLVVMAGYKAGEVAQGD